MVTWAFMSEGYLKRELKHDSPPSSVGGEKKKQHKRTRLT